MALYKLKKPVMVESTDAFMGLVCECGSGREDWILGLRNRNIL